MAGELKDKISSADVQRPKLLQEAGSIAGAKKYNVLVKLSNISRPATANRRQTTEDAQAIVDKQSRVEATKKELAVRDKKFVGEGYYTGMVAPYPRANNYLYNKRTGKGTTSFEE